MEGIFNIRDDIIWNRLNAIIISISYINIIVSFIVIISIIIFICNFINISIIFYRGGINIIIIINRIRSSIIINLCIFYGIFRYIFIYYIAIIKIISVFILLIWCLISSCFNYIICINNIIICISIKFYVIRRSKIWYFILICLSILRVFVIYFDYSSKVVIFCFINYIISIWRIRIRLSGKIILIWFNWCWIIII